MAKRNIIPVVLAGGAGNRLWPLSRKSYPKQFSKLVSDETLFQQTARRLTSSEKLKFNNHIIVTNSDFRFIVGEQLEGIGLQTSHIIIEPEAKNTGPAILAASLYAIKADPEAILLVAPSDHIIPDVDAFHRAVLSGVTYALAGKIVTFGVKPTKAETGYGYLELLEETSGSPSRLKQFVEKPDSKTAEKMVSTGRFLWNAGIFLFRAKDMVSAFERHASNLIKPVTNAIEWGTSDLGFFRLNPEAWLKCESVSIDYAIMESFNSTVVVPFESHWSDLGSWNAVYEEQKRDKNGVATSVNALAIDCKNSFIRSESNTQQIVGLGLEDIIAIAMPDAVLVAHKSREQDVKTVVNKLKEKNVSQAESFSKDHRPWGWFETLSLGRRFQVKRIMVKPAAALSLQSHKYRSEHWVVVEGMAQVTVGDEIKILTEGQSVYIPLGQKHRLENPGDVGLLLIEVQTGSYLGEDDIIRYEDNYARK